MQDHLVYSLDSYAFSTGVRSQDFSPSKKKTRLRVLIFKPGKRLHLESLVSCNIFNSIAPYLTFRLSEVGYIVTVIGAENGK